MDHVAPLLVRLHGEEEGGAAMRLPIMKAILLIHCALWPVRAAGRP
jgi:hypothetical protein